MTLIQTLNYASAVVGIIAFGLWFENKPKLLMWIWLIALAVFALTK